MIATLPKLKTIKKLNPAILKSGITALLFFVVLIWRKFDLVGSALTTVGILACISLIFFSIKHPAFVAKRLGYGLVVILLVTLIILSIIYLAPVDPAQLTFGQNADAAMVEQKQKEIGLDKPLSTQFRLYLNDISPVSIHANTDYNAEKYSYFKLLPLGEKVLALKTPYLRESFQSGRKVSEMLIEAVPQTFILAATAMFFGVLIGVILGIIASLKQYSWFDNMAVITSTLGYSLPSYVTGIIIAIIFGYYLGPYTGLNLQGGLTDIDNFTGERVFVWKNLILPAIALGIRPIALITQLTRSSMLDVLNEDYIRTAKAKGLSFYKTVFKHALRNALNPVLTAASGWFASLLAGAFFVEKVFNFNGLGLLTINALVDYDLPVVLGSVLFAAFVFVIINILVDVFYAVLDPRVTVD